jgi:hypothetical protein
MIAVRQQICDNLVTRLKAINMMNGYYSDYATIDEWRLTGFDSSELPAIDFQDQKEIVRSFDFDSIINWSLMVSIILFVKDNDVAEKLRNRIFDVFKCVFSDRSCGGYATNIVPVSNEIFTSQAENVYGDIEIIFEVQYSTRADDLSACI